MAGNTLLLSNTVHHMPAMLPAPTACECKAGVGTQVNAEAIKIGKEAEEANAIASECQAGLDKALPALQAAEEALNVLTKKDMSELKVSCSPLIQQALLLLSCAAGCIPVHL